jgi:hypothetical protein
MSAPDGAILPISIISDGEVLSFPREIARQAASIAPVSRTRKYATVNAGVIYGVAAWMPVPSGTNLYLHPD